VATAHEGTEHPRPAMPWPTNLHSRPGRRTVQCLLHGWCCRCSFMGERNFRFWCSCFL